MTFSQKYSLVHFIAPINDGVQFEMADWPLHTTLADVFAIDRESSKINDKLNELCARFRVTTIEATHDTVLGTTPVILLDISPQLLELHTAIVSLLEENGAKFNTPAFTREGFIAHSTLQKNARLYPGDTVTIDSVSLVDMFPGEDWQQRKVLATYRLKS